MSKRSLGEYGDIEMIDIGGSLRRKRATEVAAAAHIRHPDAAQFNDPDELIECWQCHKQKHYTCFDVDKRYWKRWFRRTECKQCRSGQRKRQRLGHVMARLYVKR